MDPKRIPLVVGVTGHRDPHPQEVERLQQTVKEILQKLQRDYPSSTVLVLTALAEGCDRIVAEAALELGIPFIAPLPLDPHEYEKDFADTPGSVEEFRRLMASAQDSIVMPFAEGVTEKNVGEPDARAEQYALAGKYVVRRCHLLMALWDDERTEKTGGTSQMVRYRLSGFPKVNLPEWSTLYPADSGAVCHIVTSRKKKNPAQTGDDGPELPDALKVRYYYTNALFSHRKEEQESEAEAAKIFTSILQRTDAFNQDLERFPELEPKFRESAAMLRPPAGPSEPAPGIDPLQARFGAADVLATKFRNSRMHALAFLSIVIVPGTFLLDQYDNIALRPIRQYFLTGFVLTMILSYVIFLIAKGKRFDAKHLDYRALAEGLKVLYFWRMAGLADDVSAQYLRKQRSELDWIRLAIRTSDLPGAIAPPPPDVFGWLEKAWVQDQEKYFGAKADSGDKVVILKKRLIIGLVVISAVLTSAMLFHWIPRWDLYDSSGLLVLFLGMIGSILAYTEKLGLTYQSKQYRLMHHLFTCAGREYHASLTQDQTPHLRSILRRLGQEALRENGDWLLLHRERPVEMHVG